MQAAKPTATPIRKRPPICTFPEGVNGESYLGGAYHTPNGMTDGLSNGPTNEYHIGYPKNRSATCPV